MKQLILVRHARATPSSPYVRDYGRTVTAGGAEDALLIGRWLAQHTNTPDLMIVSGAARTRATSDVIAVSYGIDMELVQYTDALYECTAQEAYDQISWLSTPDMKTILVVGHNPSISQLVSVVAAGATVLLPTTGVAIIEFDDETEWTTMKNGRVRETVTPTSIVL